tara:strand:+ start:257 stop:463 length:207 start_codon:yes stop_codon:yes gene_type:complete
MQNQPLMYEEPQISHALYAVLTIIFFPLALLWYFRYKQLAEEANSNRSMALSEFECDKCGGDLMVLSN